MNKAIKIDGELFPVTVTGNKCVPEDGDRVHELSGAYSLTVYTYSTPDNAPCVEYYDINCRHGFFDLFNEDGSEIPTEEWEAIRTAAREMAEQ